MPSSPKLCDGRAYSNNLEEFNKCLELPSDSEKYSGVVVDEFSKLVLTRKLLCSGHLDVTWTLFVSRTASQKLTEFNLDTISHSNMLGGFEVCFDLPSDSKDQFGLFVVGKFSELEHAIK